MHSSVARNRWKLKEKWNRFDYISINRDDLCVNLPFLHDCRILAMIVGMHLHIAGADVDFVTFPLQTMIVRLFAVVRTFRIELNRTIVTR